MNHSDSENLEPTHISNFINGDKYDNDDVISFKLNSDQINLFYSQLVKYSKIIRDSCLFSDVVNIFKCVYTRSKKFQIYAKFLILRDF